MSTLKVGIIGCGSISRRYTKGIARFDSLQLVGCADLVQELADRLAADSGIRAYSGIDELLADPEIDIVVNITPPVAHRAVTLQALEAGKHVYVEKPITVDVSEAIELQQAADAAGLVLGSAPDTFLGSGGQTARAAIDSGLIGDPVGASLAISHSKAELWHPNPTFLFKPGGGPLLDLGPYYITALVNLLGPVETVAGMTRVGAPVRTVQSPNRTVETIEVETTTHAAAVLRTVGGAIVTLQASFDVWDSEHPRIEIYGTKGTLSVPDPNTFDGDVRVRLHGDDGWRTLDRVFPATAGPEMDEQMLRGFGVADLAAAAGGGELRVNAGLATHVLEVLQAVETSSREGTIVRIASLTERPAPYDGTGLGFRASAD